MRTLLVEDDSLQRAALEEGLRRLGLDVTAVPDANAGLVAHLTDAEVRFYVNPRNESLENELVVRNDQFMALGLNPVTLSEGLLEEVIDVAARYKDRVNYEKILPSSRWRADIPFDREGSAEPATLQPV